MHKSTVGFGVVMTVIGGIFLFVSLVFYYNLSLPRSGDCRDCSDIYLPMKSKADFALIVGLILSPIGALSLIAGLKDISLASFSRNTKGNQRKT